MKIKYFILNHPAFTERRRTIINSLDNEEIEYSIIDGFHPDEIDYENLTNTDYNLNRGILINQIGRYSYYNNPNKVGKGSISLILKHIECWKQHISSDCDYAVILEDDCEIIDGFKSLMISITNELDKTPYDLVMIGSFLDFYSPDKNENLLKFHPYQKTRCTHAYLISKNSSQIMLDGFKCLNNSIDFKMNEVIELKKLKVAWVEPGLKQI